jgi:S-adenosylmethionine-diacylgycerolhomoserine-N-methlytransferase
MESEVALAPDDIRSRMDRMYRPQTLVYDLTRKYYLLGRDRLIAEMGARPGQSVLEVGCGTGRNLVAIGRRYPGVRLHGLDAAAPMLEAARRSSGAPASRPASPAASPRNSTRGDGARAGSTTSSSPTCCPWSTTPRPRSGRRSARSGPGGTLHVVDFGDMAGLPAPAPALMRAWLARFGVRHRPEVEATLRELAAAGRGRLEVQPIARRYALLLRSWCPDEARGGSVRVRPSVRDR